MERFSFGSSLMQKVCASIGQHATGHIQSLCLHPEALQDAVETMRKMFASDFNVLGYSVDPLVEAPQSRAACWMRGQLEDSTAGNWHVKSKERLRSSATVSLHCRLTVPSPHEQVSFQARAGGWLDVQHV